METKEKKTDHWVVCPKCHTVHQKIPLACGEKAKCYLCNKVLYGFDRRMLEKSLALGITGLIFFVVANLFPLIRIEFLSHEQHTTILSMITALAQSGFYVVAVSVVFLVFLFPLAVILLYIALSWLMLTSRSEQLVRQLLILLTRLQPWNMIEIFIVGVLIALFKLTNFVEIYFGISFWALVLFVLVSIYLSRTITVGDLWEWHQRLYCEE